MANLRLNQTNIIGTLIPDVYINNVILEMRGDAIKERNPHIDFEGEAGVYGSSQEQEGSLSVTVDLLLKDEIEKGLVSSWLEQFEFSKYLKVFVALSTRPDISDVLRDKVLFANRLFAASADYGDDNLPAHGIGRAKTLIRDALGGDITDSEIENHFYHETRSATEQQNTNSSTNFVEIQEDRDGNKIRNTAVRVRFSTRGNPEHLTVCTFTFLDLQRMSQDFGNLDFGNFGNITRGSVALNTGRTVSRTVILNSQVVETAVVFRDSDGSVWPGPVHQMSPGVWMGGRYHEDPQFVDAPFLTKTTVPNIGVQDFRNVRDSDKLIQDLSFFESRAYPGLDKTFKERVKDNLSSAERSSYFSDIFLARSFGDYASMLFSFNMGKFIKENTKFPLIFEGRPDLLHNNCQILNLKVIRRRVQKPPRFKDSTVGYEVDEKDIIPFDKNKPVYTVIEGSEDSPGIFSVFAGENTNNSIREADIRAGSQIRSFTVADRTMGSITDGYYQYGVEIEIQDRLINHINKKLADLLIARKNLYEYFVEAAKPTGRFKDPTILVKDPHIVLEIPRPSLERIDHKGNYNPLTNRFSQRFMEEQDALYDPPNAPIPPWNQAVLEISELMRLFNPSGAPESRDEIMKLWKLAAPRTGSPDGILLVLKLVDDIIAKIGKLIGVATTPTTDLNSEGAPMNPFSNLSSGLSSGAPKKDTYKISYFFTNAIFDANNLKEAGFHYFFPIDNHLQGHRDIIAGSRDNNGIAGMRVFTGEKFKKRVDDELGKYFWGTHSQDRAQGIFAGNVSDTRGASSEAAHIFADQYSDQNGSGLGTLGPAYFSPNRITIRRRAGRDDFLEPHEMRLGDGLVAKIISDIVNIKSPPNQPKSVPISKSHYPDPREAEARSDHRSRIVRDNLIEVLADKNCTVEMRAKAPRVRLEESNRSQATALEPTFTSVTERHDHGLLTDYLGDDTLAPEQLRENLVRLEDIHTDKDGDVFLPGPLFLQLLLNFIIEDENLLRKRRNLTRNEINHKYSINNFNLKKSSNAIDIAAQLATRRGTSVQEIISKMPNQIKALFASSLTVGLGSLHSRFQRFGEANWEDIFADEDILYDPIKHIQFSLRYMHLNKVEVLVGYETILQEVSSPTSGHVRGAALTSPFVGPLQPPTSRREESQLKQPIWSLLTENILQNFIDTGREMLCRMRPYVDSMMGIQPLKGIQLPIYDQYFIIKPKSPIVGLGQLGDTPPAPGPAWASVASAPPSREVPEAVPISTVDAVAMPMATPAGTADVTAMPMATPATLINWDRMFRDITREYVSDGPTNTDAPMAPGITKKIY